VNQASLTLRIRFWVVAMIAGLVLAGATAFPLVHEVQWLNSWVFGPRWLTSWIHTIDAGIVQTSARYPFMAYGTDWLAYAHLMIAIAFVGVFRQPVRNVWIVQWGMIACLSIIPLALIAGPVRHIPFWWSCIDMSFGVFGLVPLLFLRHYIRLLESRDRHETPDLIAASA
jgi:hypothetical protein